MFGVLQDQRTIVLERLFGLVRLQDMAGSEICKAGTRVLHSAEVLQAVLARPGDLRSGFRLGILGLCSLQFWPGAYSLGLCF